MRIQTLMKIVLVDAHTANPGDLSWEPVETLGEVTSYPRSTDADVLERCADAEAVLTNKVPFDAARMDALPNLRYIGVTATGYNIIDVEAARQRNIAVTNIPAYGTETVAQACFALVLELCNHVGLHAEAVTNGEWNASPDFCFWHKPLTELSGLKFGLVGYGAIAQATARIARAFNLQVLVHTRTPREEANTRFVDKETLFKESDIVSLHCPLTPDTEHIVNEAMLSLMKPSAFLINTSRGPLVDEHALAKALYDQRIAGAGLDVLSSEPPSADNPLLMAPNCYITPHIAWATQAARGRVIQMAAENLQAFMQGEQHNRVD